MHKVEPYEQTALNSCLTCCLMMLSRYHGKKLRMSRKLELKLLKNGMKFDSKNYDIGQLHEIARRYHIDINYFIENLDDFHYVRKLPFSNHIVIHPKKITMDFIKEMLEQQPVILSIDPDGIFDEGHYTHFILLTKRNGKFVSAIDPWTGEEHMLETKILAKSLSSLQRISASPVLIAKRT